jgi:hypothetical protein
LLPGNLLFIGLREGGGAVARSTMARLLRRLVELGVVMAMLYVSRRGERWRQLGRGGPGWVALLPRRPRRSREQVVVSGAGGHGSGLGACLAASRCHCGAQRVHRGSRACSRWWRGACPGRALVRRPRHAGRVWARCLRRVSSSSSTTAMLGWRRGLVGAWWRGGQGGERRRRGGGCRVGRHGRHGHV